MMTDRKKIIGVGNPIVDSIAEVDDAFLEGVEGGKGGMILVDAEAIRDLLGRVPKAPKVAPGGSAGNTLFALAKLGATASFLGKTGNCDNGAYYRDTFSALGGDSSHFKIADQANGHCVSLVTPDGERTMRTDLGAAMALAPEEISAADFSGSTHAHIEGYLLFNEALMRRVVESAKEAGCTISLDLASYEVVDAAKAILGEILRDYVDIVFANEDEGAAFTGVKEDYSTMAQKLADYCDIAAIKVGALGAYIASGSGVEHVGAVPVDRVVDTTAAGDLWEAGFLYGWSLGWPLAECAALGARLGAAVVQEQGSILPEKVWADILSSVSTAT